MTNKIFLIAGVAGLALASPADAQRERGARGERAEASQSKGKAQRPKRAERQRAQRVERQQAQRPRAQQQRIQRAERPRLERQRAEPQRAERPRIEQRQRIERAERPRIERQRLQRADRQRIEQRQRVRNAERSRIQRIDLADRRRADKDDIKLVRRQTLRDDRRNVRDRRGSFDRLQMAPRLGERAWRPMKDLKDRPIAPIGKRIDPSRYSSYVPSFSRARFKDTPRYYYRYDDDLGYLYRVERNRNIVRAAIPMFGGYGYGNPWPTMYRSSFVPSGYRSYYYDTPNYHYRYDGYGIYRVDAETQLITALVALLAGQGLGVGQLLPTSYSTYNVPLAYRSTYYDRDDAWYRYGDGYIYEVDPYSRRIAQRYPLYGSGYDYMVGQPWPVAYPGYNVPYGYRSVYYDTPQYHYRYANGGIYQVDPTSQVIQALVALVTGQQFQVGQPFPASYASYNVPLAYRDRYFDDDDRLYRYADGYIYRVDPDQWLVEEAIPVYV